MKIKRRLRYALREPLVRWLIHGFAKLSLPLNHRIGGWFGLLLYHHAGKLRHITQTNLKRCFPELDEAARKRLTRISFIESGKALSESGPLWLWPKERLLGLVKEVHGEEHLRKALAQGKGAIIFTPHLGNWEMAGLYLSAHYPITSLYRPHRIQSLDKIMHRGRERLGATLVPTDKRGVRQLLKALKQGELIGMLPDQDPGYEGGQFAPFFGIEANTMILTSRLARKSQAPVIGCWAERLANGEGFRMHFSPASKSIHDEDLRISLTATNREVELMIRHNPSQYQWSYARFRRRPEGEAGFY